MKKLLVLALALMLSMVGNVFAADVTLEWDANTEADLAGYKIFHAERIGNQTTAWVEVGDVSAPTVTYVDTVPDGSNFAWLVIAYDIEDNQSFVSNMVELYDRTAPASPANLRRQ